MWYYKHNTFSSDFDRTRENQMTWLLVVSIIVILIVLIGASFLVARNLRANKILKIPEPVRAAEEVWTTKQCSRLVICIVNETNKLQKIENEIDYCSRLIKWHSDRVNAYRKKFSKAKAEQELVFISETQRQYSSLCLMRDEICNGIKNVTSKDETSSIRELSFFSVFNDNSLCRLWGKPRGIAISGSNRFIFLPYFVVRQSKKDISIEEYATLKLSESYQLERIKFDRSCAKDDEIAGEYWLHEKKKGGPDLRYSYNPKSYIVFRGVLIVKDNEAEAILKFSNRIKCHKAFTQLTGVINELSSEDSKAIYKKMLTCDASVSIEEIKLMIEEDKKINKSNVEVDATANESMSNNDQAGCIVVQDKNSEEQENNDNTQGSDNDELKKSETILSNNNEEVVSIERERQPKWDKYETALLIEGYFKIVHGGSRNDVASTLSAKLRNIAVRDGETISDTYRNVSGVTWQLTYIKKAFSEEGYTDKTPPQVFKEIVDLYKNDRKSFNILLQIAHEKCGDVIENDNHVEQERNAWKSGGEEGVLDDRHSLLDFNIVNDYSHTKPEIISYCGEIESGIACWYDVYKSLAESLYSDYSSEVKAIADSCNYNFISSNAEKLNNPIKLCEGIYVESIYEANKIIESIKVLLDYCGVSYDNVQIRYSYVQDGTEEKTGVFVDGNSNQLHQSAMAVSVKCNHKLDGFTELEKKLCTIIGKYFKSGCLPGAITYRKVKRFYNEEYSEICDLTNDEIKDSLDKSCIFANGKYYDANTLLPDELKARLAGFLHDTLKLKGYVYYQTILETFGFDLTAIIADEGLLKAYLRDQFNEYYYFDEYIGTTLTTEINAESEIEQLLLDAVYPVSPDWIYSRLPHLTEDVIKKAMIIDPKILVSNGFKRFHIDSVGLTEEELGDISKLIQEVIIVHTYMFSNELLMLLKTKMPTLYERIKDFGDLGIRNAIESKLGNKFRFNGNIISRFGVNIDNYSVFKSFAETERYFKLSSVCQLKEQIGVGVIYFDAINEVASRINAEDFVPTETLVFDSHAIDGVIQQFIPHEICSIKNACNFAVYPATCYPWTNYLLETYVAKFSNKFKLIHNSYSEGSCVGAIVKKSSPINSLDEVVVSVLTDYKDINTAAEALDYLVEEGYIAKRRYKGIDELLTKAKAKG